MVKQIFICLTIGFLCAFIQRFVLKSFCVGKLLIYNKLYRNLSQIAINCDK